jgi:hypothetical protein
MDIHLQRAWTWKLHKRRDILRKKPQSSNPRLDYPVSHQENFVSFSMSANNSDTQKQGLGASKAASPSDFDWYHSETDDKPTDNLGIGKSLQSKAIVEPSESDKENIAPGGNITV